ncbi:MFS transporter [Oceanibium sediminis]|uniref:MFS transporter n=1 Tax=Oceanibium sediminis TaxID=2026339 RepID=UPI000DD4DE9D|nr:MFS transporter [Oceanibium sediminis]
MSTTDNIARRNVLVLVCAQAILGAQMPISFVLGGLSGQVLSPDKCLATLPISVIVLTTMLTAPWLSNVMQSHGRRTGFLIGALGGTIGGILSVAGLYLGSFAIFLLGSAGTGVYMAAQGFYRFAAADTASPEFRPKAISWVMAGGLLSAVFGPQLVKLTDGLTDPVPFAGGYMIIIALNIVGAGIFFALKIPKPPAPEDGAAPGRTRGELLRDPKILVAMICAMVSYALMNLVMTSTPLAVVGCGFTTAHAADIVSAHVLAMFAPSFFTGNLIARFGSKPIIATGLVLLAIGGLVAINGVELWNFYVTLILLGLGWNFGFIGATTMLSNAHTPEERGRVQGMNDFAVFGMVSVASLSSGFLMNCSGGSPVEGWTAVNIAMLPLLLLAGSTLIWFAFSGKEQRA